jgi:hypothetical protein
MQINNKYYGNRLLNARNHEELANALIALDNLEVNQRAEVLNEFVISLRNPYYTVNQGNIMEYIGQIRIDNRYNGVDNLINRINYIQTAMFEASRVRDDNNQTPGEVQPPSVSEAQRPSYVPNLQSPIQGAAPMFYLHRPENQTPGEVQPPSVSEAQRPAPAQQDQRAVDDIYNRIQSLLQNPENGDPEISDDEIPDENSAQKPLVNRISLNRYSPNFIDLTSNRNFDAEGLIRVIDLIDNSQLPPSDRCALLVNIFWNISGGNLSVENRDAVINRVGQSAQSLPQEEREIINSILENHINEIRGPNNWRERANRRQEERKSNEQGPRRQ